ncbi:MAG: type IV pilus biogenesis protein EbsA, partial [Synechococcus sp.]
GQAPLETISCYLTFSSNPSLNYSFELVTHELVSWLMQVDVQNGKSGDLPDAFWQWLLVGTEQDDDSA